MNYVSIRKLAATGLISEHTIRLLVKQGKIPYIKSGNRVLLCPDVVKSALETLSKEGEQ